MIGFQPMLTFTVLYICILCHICNVTLFSHITLWSSGEDVGLYIQKFWVQVPSSQKINFAKFNFKT